MDRGRILVRIFGPPTNKRAKCKKSYYGMMRERYTNPNGFDEAYWDIWRYLLKNDVIGPNVVVDPQTKKKRGGENEMNEKYHEFLSFTRGLSFEVGSLRPFSLDDCAA